MGTLTHFRSPLAFDFLKTKRASCTKEKTFTCCADVWGINAANATQFLSLVSQNSEELIRVRSTRSSAILSVAAITTTKILKSDYSEGQKLL